MKRVVLRGIQFGGIAVSTIAVQALVMHTSAQAGGAPTVSPLFYAGSLVENGVPVDASVPVTFELLAHGRDEPLCVVEEEAVEVSSGEFRVDVSACAAALRQNSDVDVVLTVRGERFPREKIGAVPFALEADHATTSDLAANVANGAVSSEALASGSVASDEVLDGALTGNDVADGSLSGTDLQDGSISTADLAGSAVDNGRLATSAVDGRVVADGSLSGIDLEDGTISTSDLAGSAVDNGRLATSAVDGRVIADGSVTQSDAPSLMRGSWMTPSGIATTQGVVTYMGTAVVGPGDRPFGIVDVSHTFPAGLFSEQPLCVVGNGDSHAETTVSAGVIPNGVSYLYGSPPSPLAVVTFRAYSTTNASGLSIHNSLRLNFICVGR
jgi:hypothetical protein